MDNHAIAGRLAEYARLLDTRGDSLYRTRAYRRAAGVVLELNRPASEILQVEGRKGLEACPGIGSHIAFTIEALIETGEFKTVSAQSANSAVPLRAGRSRRLTG